MKHQAFDIDLQHLLVPKIKETSKRMTYLILKTLKENGIDRSREQMIILKHLIKTDGLVQNDLAFITNRDKTSLTRIITNMEKNGLLNRVQCQHDQRRNKIFITPLGREEFQRGFPIVKNIATQIQEGLSQKEIDTTIKVLEKITQNLIELEDEKK